jgi:hypothetical protein
MKSSGTLAALLESFFTQRLMNQRQASPHTISSYRDTFRLLLLFTQQRLHKAPAKLAFEEMDAPLIAAFLDDLEKSRGITIRSRNLRLTAIRSFFHYAAYEEPSRAAQIQACWQYRGSVTRAAWFTSWTAPKSTPYSRLLTSRLGWAAAITPCCWWPFKPVCGYRS